MKALTEEQRATLEDLYRRVDARAGAISGSHDWWPCRKGCDHCCRHLAAPLTVSEWELTFLWEAYQALAPEVRAEIRARVAALEGTGRPYTCPFLDRASGGCRVYAHRPLACRTYGFYVSRDLGAWCHFIQALLERHGEGDIIWGNHDAMESTLERLSGPPLSVLQWFAAHPEGATGTESGSHEE